MKLALKRPVFRPPGITRPFLAKYVLCEQEIRKGPHLQGGPYERSSVKVNPAKGDPRSDGVGPKAHPAGFRDYFAADILGGLKMRDSGQEDDEKGLCFE